MNNTIWKYELKVADLNNVELPKGANILCVQLQSGLPTLWVEVNILESEKQVHVIETFGTGHKFDSSPRRYIGTYQMQQGALVFHLYQYLGV